MLSIDNVAKIYQTARTQHYALKDIHLEVVPGEIQGILGRSHSGKTTLLRCIHCLEKIDAGSIVLDNSPLSLLNEKTQILARRAQGMVFAEPLLLASRTVAENISLPLELAGYPKSERDGRLQAILQMTALQDKAHDKPCDLNLGQQFRVSIARALVLQPKIILCDDITQKCDAKTAHGLLKLLRELNERYHFTIVLATQSMEVIKTVCHNVAILHQGEIVEQGRVADIFAHPRTDITREFVKSVTRLEMPTALRRRLKGQGTEHSHPVMRVTIDHQQNQEPLIAQVIQQFDLTMNILQAHLETIRDEHIGIMIVELNGQKSDIQSATDYLAEKGIHIEVLGYVL